MNLAASLVRAGRIGQDRPAIWLGTCAVATYADFARQAARIAGGLRTSLGLNDGDRVAILMSNTPDYLPCLYACWHAGLVAVPINAKLHAREVTYILENSGARLLMVTSDLAGVAGEAVATMAPQPQVVECGSADLRALSEAEPIALHETASDDPAWLFYTSGTTGRPKGATLTHRNLLAMTLSYFADVDSISLGDAILHAAPMSHGSGLYALPHVSAMAAQIVPESGGFDPKEVAALIGRHRGVTMFAAPTMLGRLVRWDGIDAADLSGLKTVIYGGGPMYLADCRQALATLGNRLVQIYGQGESPMTISVLPRWCHTDTSHPRYLERLASVGYAQGVVELRILAPDGTAMPVGERGEVVVRGETVMTGYWRDPEATEAALREGWLWTGDVGSLDQDGFLTLSDRTKDVIISGGSNIYPREVEEVLLQHPDVLEASVVGQPHASWGEEVIAFVVPRVGATLTPEELDALCLQHIARFKRPRLYCIVDALPKNNYGKVLKTSLRAALDGPGGIGRPSYTKSH